MLTFASKYAQNIFSQNGENGIIDECINRIKPQLKVAVEFGAPTREYCSNINHLTDWERIFFDINPSDPQVTEAEITPANVNEIIPDCSVLSIDVDGNDYNIWKAYEGRPDLVVIEINSGIHPMNDAPVSDLQHGTGYLPMVQLGISKGYVLLCHTGNLVFLRADHHKLFPEIQGTGIENYPLYFNNSWQR